MAKKLEDTWAFVPIGEPFPSSPVRVRVDTNQFVALWYKHGKPTCGRAWNNGGVLECSFPYNGKELTGKKELGGEIQVLIFAGTYDTNGFLYNWIQYKDRAKDDNYQLVRCGNITPALMQCSNGQHMMGQIDLNTEQASASFDGKAESSFTGKQVQDMWVIVRNLTTCRLSDPTTTASLSYLPSQYRSVSPSGRRWMGGSTGETRQIPPLRSQSFGTTFENGSKQEQAVALWYKHGDPVMGRAYEIGAQLAATFGWDGKEFSGDVGSAQLQCYHSKEEQGFELSWRPFKECKADGWYPVHVKEVAPCVITTKAGAECLGKVFPESGESHHRLGEQRRSGDWTLRARPDGPLPKSTSGPLKQILPLLFSFCENRFCSVILSVSF